MNTELFEDLPRSLQQILLIEDEAQKRANGLIWQIESGQMTYKQAIRELEGEAA